MCAHTDQPPPCFDPAWCGVLEHTSTRTAELSFPLTADTGGVALLFIAASRLRFFARHWAFAYYPAVLLFIGARSVLRSRLLRRAPPLDRPVGGALRAPL